jgi:hypothetical protein
MIGFALAVLALVALGLSSQLGWSVDSRDGADWRPSDGGVRAGAWSAER